MNRALLLAASLLALQGCAARGTPAPAAPAPGECRQGPLTYYADSLAGRPTASGEPYDPGKMTAAHRSLPLGSWLDVSWKQHHVRVRVNDRGGPRGGVDLSRSAAERLGMIRAGRVQGSFCRAPGTASGALDGSSSGRVYLDPLPGSRPRRRSSGRTR
jgi:rare lipoprotein A